MTFALAKNKDLSLVAPGLFSYQTRVKAAVYSHNASSAINISKDIVTCSMNKTVKGTGTLNITLNASRNFLNLLFPDDLINVYFQHDADTGWIRTFFGYINRIEESYSVAETGVPTTVYTVVCSGWEKAIDKTQIYFNPALNVRPEFSGSDFATLNIAGLAIMNTGIKASGTPADIMLNLLMLHMGFGAQWILPQNAGPKISSAMLRARQELVSGILIQAVEETMTGETLAKVRDVITTGELDRAAREPTADPAATPEDGDPSDTVEETATQGDINVAEVERLLQVSTANGGVGGTGTPLRSAISLYLNNARSSTTNTTLLDLVNLTDHVERLAIDGYILDASIWEAQGSLLNIIRSKSNEAINELFYDLRPALVSGNQESTSTSFPVDSNWSKELDEFGGNGAGEGTNKIGPRYELAAVMREYPFSTIYKVDASAIPNEMSATGHLGIFYLGAIFSHMPNEPGRHTIRIPTIHPAHRINGQTTLSDMAEKHLDVAVISEKEIRSSRLGRSDADHYNLFEATIPLPLGGEAQRYMMISLLPIVTPIHIMRHGLRVRSFTSDFSLFNISTSNNSSATPPEEPSDPAVTDDAPFSTEVGLPVADDPSLRFSSFCLGDYGYRGRPATATINSWKFHNGIDISGTEGEVEAIAIADGLVVASAPAGTAGVSGYGNTIVVYHPQFSGPNGEKIYALYAHLHDRIVGAAQTVRSPAAAFARGHHPRGRRFQPIRVSKGQVLGHIGRTLGTVANPSQVFHTSGGAHLHFEIDFRWAPKNNAETPDVPYSVIPLAGHTEADAISYVQGTLHKPGTNSRNMDPEVFYSTLPTPINLVAAVRAAAGSSEEVDGTLLDAEEGAAGSTEESSPSRENAAEHEDETSTIQDSGTPRIVGNVSNATSQEQLARWAILNDHWYQHNLEYLSGTITMRGAPEIRVGMRLDIIERNMSFYIEGVQHTWEYPNEMKTVLQVTRGQNNNPYPAYAIPPAGSEGSHNVRRKGSRLAVYPSVADPVAVRNSVSLVNTAMYPSDGVTPAVDSPDNPDNWGENGYRFDETAILELVPAESNDEPTVDPIVTDTTFDADGLSAVLQVLGTEGDSALGISAIDDHFDSVVSDRTSGTGNSGG